jgi:hypothetical protein
VFAIALGVLGLRKPGELSAYDWGRLTGNIVGVLILPTFLAWAAWRLSGRSRLARTLTFFVVFGLLAASQLLQAGRRARRPDAFADLRAEQERNRQEQRALLDAGQPLDGQQAEKFVANAAAHLRKTASSASGNERLASEAGQALAERMLAVTRRYNAALVDADMGTFFEIAPLADATKLAARRKAVEAFAAANSELQTVQANGAALLRAELEKRRVTPAYLRQTLAGYEESTGKRMPLILKIRDTDARLASTMLEFLDLAAGKHGTWRIEQPGGEVVFDSEEATTRYRDVLKRIDAISEEQRSYQQQVVAP